MGNAGRVLMIPKGEYNSATTYQMLDFVYYQGRSYVCKQTSTGNVPTNTTYWQALTGDASAEIQALTNYVADTGVKNLLDNSVKDIGTFSGVTVSQDSKGRFILNGTATANDSIRCGTVTLPAGKYSFNGMTQNGSSSTFFLNITPRWDGTTNYNLETTGDYSGTTAGELTFIVRIYFRSGVTFNNTVFEPMIRDASITDPTYQPYAKTNVELTQDTTYKTGSFAAGESGFFHSLTIKQFGKVVTINGYVQNISPVGNTPLVLGTVSGVDMPPLDLRATAAIASAAYEDPSQMAYLTLTTSGELKVRCENAATNVAAYFSVSYIV